MKIILTASSELTSPAVRQNISRSTMRLSAPGKFTMEEGQTQETAVILNHLSGNTTLQTTGIPINALAHVKTPAMDVKLAATQTISNVERTTPPSVLTPH